MNAPADLNALSAPQATCEECQGLFDRKRAWARFCGPRCRNGFHGRQRRDAEVVKSAPAMYEALRRIAAGCEDPAGVAAAAIAHIKPPA